MPQHLPYWVVWWLEDVDDVDLLEPALALEFNIDLHKALTLHALVNQVHVRLQDLRVLKN